MPQFRTFPAGDTTLHGPRPDVDDLRPDAFRFERPGNLGQGDKVFPSLWGLPFISNTFIVVMFVFVQI